MSDRDALISTAADELGNWIEDGPVARRRLAGGIVDALLPLLAAHPAEPAPVITDEAVQDLHAGVVTQFRRHGQYTLADARAALEAAAPLLGPRPLLDREAVSRAFRREAGPWLTANRDAVTDAATEAVMKLARPMPTREQIEQTVAEVASVTGLAKYFKSGGLTDPSDLDEFTHAIEVLLNGAES